MTVSEPEQPETPAPAASASPGWYPHPTMANTQGYWDGRAWTEHLAPAVPTVASDATGAAAKVFLLLVAVGVVVLMIAVGASFVG